MAKKTTDDVGAKTLPKGFWLKYARIRERELRADGVNSIVTKEGKCSMTDKDTDQHKADEALTTELATEYWKKYPRTSNVVVASALLVAEGPQADTPGTMLRFGIDRAIDALESGEIDEAFQGALADAAGAFLMMLTYLEKRSAKRPGRKSKPRK